MRACLTCMVLFAAAGLAGAGEEAAPPQDARPDEATEVTVRGRVGPRPAKAKEGAAAVLTVKPKKGERPEEPKTVYLYAKGDLAAKLAELAKEKAKVYVTGVLVADGINVTSVSQPVVARQANKAGATPEDKRPVEPDEDF